MNYRIDMATETIALELPEGELEIPKSDPMWEEFIDTIFSGYSEDTLLKLAEEFRSKRTDEG